MVRKELIVRVAGRTGEPVGVVSNVLDAAVDEIVAAVRAGEPVKIHGFGTFKLRQQAGRRDWMNPGTGEKRALLPSRHPVFAPAIGFLRRVRDVRS